MGLTWFLVFSSFIQAIAIGGMVFGQIRHMKAFQAFLKASNESDDIKLTILRNQGKRIEIAHTRIVALEDRLRS